MTTSVVNPNIARGPGRTPVKHQRKKSFVEKLSKKEQEMNLT